MKLIGYWMQTLLDQDLPLPQELVGDVPDSVRNALCNYLRRGEYYRGFCGRSWCRFHCGVDDREMGSQEFTDGEWVWPEGLVHYVGNHQIVLPEEFVTHARSGRPARRIPNQRAPSLDYWIQWCRSKRPPVVRERLAKALAEAHAAKPALIECVIESLIQDTLAREKEGSDPCIFAGCTRRAMAGCRICARHSINDMEIEWRTAHLYLLPDEI